MHLNADLLRVLIHHVKDAAVAEHRATEREQAKETAFVERHFVPSNKVALSLQEGTCARCNYVGYSDHNNEKYSLVPCPTCLEVICLDCEKASECVLCEHSFSYCAKCENGCVDCGELMCDDCIRYTYAHCGKCNN
jgi:hypothetical protein